MDRARRLATKIFNYGLSAIGPVGTAGSQFLLSITLLHTLDPAPFGSFSFLLVASQFSTGLWSALFCAPMPILLAQGEAADRQRARRSLMSANLGFSILACIVFASLAVLLHAPLEASLLFGAYGGVMLLRWFARAYAYALDERWRTITSDFIYSLVLIASLGLVIGLHSKSLVIPYAGLLISAGLGLIPFGRVYLRQQFLDVVPKDALGYSEVWKRHAGWSLTGVLTTEATANAHAYIVTLLSGPAAFAPLAASALLMRPIGVTTNALTEMERPQMARQIAQGRRDQALRATSFFRFILMAAWLATVIIAFILMRFAPHALFPKTYDPRYLAIGTILWLAIAGVRLLRAPESVLLQAAGQFRPLAYASIMSCGVSVATVAAFLFIGGPLWSLVGILLGEGVFAVWIWRQKRRWEKATAPEPREQIAPSIPVDVLEIGAKHIGSAPRSEGATS